MQIASNSAFFMVTVFSRGFFLTTGLKGAVYGPEFGRTLPIVKGPNIKGVDPAWRATGGTGGAFSSRLLLTI